MTQVPSHDRDVIEEVIYLPMVLTLLERDKKIFQEGKFKIKEPYLEMLDQTSKLVHKDLHKAKSYLSKNNIKLEKSKSDELFTRYMFFYKGYEEEHNYFNPALRNRVENLLREYLSKA